MQFDAVTGSSNISEQQKNLSLLSRMLGKEGTSDTILNKTKAVKSMHDEVGATMALDSRERRREERMLRKAMRKKTAKKAKR